MTPEQEQMLSAPSDAYPAGAWCELANDLADEVSRLRECVGLLRPDDAAHFWRLYRTHPALVGEERP